MNIRHTLVLAGGLALATGSASGQLQINELRIDQPSTDNDEYFELSGPPGMSLAGHTYLVIGDGTGGSGTIEAVVDLTGQSIQASGFFVAAEATFTLGTANLVTNLNFENSDNVTHVLVTGFTGANGQDLDTDDDGMLDLEPWTSVVDAIGLVESPDDPPVGTERVYGAALGFENIGPESVPDIPPFEFVPAHVYRCTPDQTWVIGPFDTLVGEDTPGAANLATCPIVPPVALAVTKDGPPVANSGTQITYTLTVSNTGAGPAANVSIIDTLPGLVSFISQTSPPNVVLIDDVEPDIEWSIASLGSMETVVIEMVAEIDIQVQGEITNSVSVSTTTMGDDPADNDDSAATVVTQIIEPPENLVISEVRINHEGQDTQEYFELRGDPGTNLTGVTYVVIGADTAGGSGGIERFIPLAGLTVPGDGLFLAVEDTWTMTPIFLADLILPSDGLDFFSQENKTHMLVANFTGDIDVDVDADDNGIVDMTAPWTHVIDAVGLIREPNPPATSDWSYGASLGFVDVGPDDIFVPGHVYRCQPEDTWAIGQFELDLDMDGVRDSDDTPGAPNGTCPAPDCPADTDGNGSVDVDDLTNVILDWGNCCSFGGDTDGDGDVDVDDLTNVILGWGLCP